MSAAYWVSMTKSARAGTFSLAKLLKSGLTKARVIWRARSARKFMKITASPSFTVAGVSPMTDAFTNSSFSPRS